MIPARSRGFSNWSHPKRRKVDCLLNRPPDAGRLQCAKLKWPVGELLA